jgi:hypothetical protein
MKTAKVTKYMAHEAIVNSLFDFNTLQDRIEQKIKIELGLGVRDMGYTRIEAEERGYRFTGILHTISDVEVMKLKTLLNHGELPPHAAIVIHEILKES